MNARFDEQGNIIHAPHFADEEAERAYGDGDISKEHLQAAVEALAERIEAAESRPPKKSAPQSARTAPQPSEPEGAGRGKATDLLDRLDALESRLESMSRPAGPRQQKTASHTAPGRSSFSPAREAPKRAASSFAGGLADFARELAGGREAQAESRPAREAPAAPAGASSTSGLESLIGDVLSEVRELRHRVDGVQRSGEGLSAIEHRVGDIDERLRWLHQDLSERREPPQELIGEIAAIRHGLEGLSSGRGLREIENRIAELGRRFDRLSEPSLETEALSRLENRLDVLGDAVERIRENRSGAVSELARQLDRLAARIERAGTMPSVDLSPLEDRLAEIAGRLEESTDTAAQFAALEERLAALTESVGAQQPQFDTSEIDRRLDAIAASLQAQPASLDLSEVHERLAAISQSLETQPDPFDASEIHERLAAISQSLESQPAPFDPAEITDRLDRLAGEISGFLTEGERGPSLQPVLDRLAALDERFDSGRVDLEQLSAIVERMEASVAEAPAERLSALEEKISNLGDNIGHLDDGSFVEDISNLRTEIAELRADIRDTPPTPDGALRSLQPAIREIRERLDRLPEEPASFNRELEAQIGRISAMLDRPAAESEALGRLEDALAGINARLDAQEQHLKASTWQAAGSGSAEEGEGGGSEALMRLASALQNDLGQLKSGAEAAEERTRQSLEAVHGTLEAVVKRMAFLERDRSFAGPGEPGDSGDVSHAAMAASSASRATQAPAPAPASAEASDRLPRIEDGPAPSSWSPAAQNRPAPPSGEEETTAGSGLLGRLSASQLLKRATGGRAESFSPRSEEDEASIDSLLEPGTGEPLSSDLAGAPSSASAYVSAAASSRGGRQRSGSEAALARAYEDFRSQGRSGDVGSGDFLNAARRAARAAAEEAAAAERDAASAKEGGSSSVLDFLKARRRMLLAGAVALAVAFAAVQYIKQRGSEAVTADGRPAVEMQAPAASGSGASSGMSLVEPTAGTDRSGQAPMPAPDRTTAFSNSITTLAPLGNAARPAAEPKEPAGTGAQGVDAEEASAPAPASTGTAASGAGGEAEIETASAPAKPAPVSTGNASSPDSMLPAAIGSDKLRRAAETGVAEAQFEVASRYAEGRGVMREPAEAVRWYERAARAGLAPAQYRLGSIYEKGRGVPKDIDRAFDWYEKAAEAGNVKAMHNLAVLYAEGGAGTPDLEKAASLFERAAERGVRDSQFNIGVLYARGLGVPQDLVQAYKWFAVAARSGDQQAKQRQDEVEQALTPELLPKARSAASSFKPLPVDPQSNMVFAPEGGWEETTGETLHVGAPGLVQRAQDLLIAHGYDPGPADGVFGEKTREAIAAFQRANDLEVSGEIDTGLIKALEEKDM